MGFSRLLAQCLSGSVPTRHGLGYCKDSHAGYGNHCAGRKACIFREEISLDAELTHRRSLDIAYIGWDTHSRGATIAATECTNEAFVFQGLAAIGQNLP